MKFPYFYNYEKKECEICGCLLQPDLKFVREHAKDTFHILKKMEKEANMDTKVFDEITKPIPDLLKEIETPIVDNVALQHIENFANELKESIRKVMVDELTKGIGEAIIQLIDSKVELYKNYFGVYALRVAEAYKKEGEKIV